LVEGRFEALHAGGLTELIGRQEELELLVRSTAKSGEGQVVLLSGEAGIGKSRLTAALLERLATEPHTRLRYFCSPQHTDSALYPIIGRGRPIARSDYVAPSQRKYSIGPARAKRPFPIRRIWNANPEQLVRRDHQTFLL
jgi:predicted ATPase